MTTKTADPVYIHGLRAENFMRLELVEIPLDGPGLVQITGDNAQGKSSVLKAILAALGGTRALPAKPVREGADHAEIDLDLGDKLVHRRINPDGSATLTVTAKDGTATFKSPQKLLDALVGQFAFDPLRLLRMKPAERLATVRALVGIDTTGQDAERQRLYEQRTGVGRDLKLLQGQLAGCVVPEVPGPAPAAAVVPPRVSVAELVTRQQEAFAVQTAQEEERDQLTRLAVDEDVQRQLLADLHREFEEAEAKLTGIMQARAAAGAVCDAQVAPDLAGLDRALREADATNAELATLERNEAARQRGYAGVVATYERALAERQAKALEAQAKSEEQERLSAAIAAIDAAKVALLAGAAFPVPGMGFGDDDLTFQGIPFAQCSASEQLRLCLGTGAAQNPRLRLIATESGNDLDRVRLREMAVWAKEHDMLVLLERVAGETPVGVVIEAGRVAQDTRAAAGAGEPADGTP